MYIHHLQQEYHLQQHILQQKVIQLQTYKKTWQQNKALDPGTEPEIIANLCRQIDDYCLGYKLPGAGGGGYLYMVAKDPQAANRIKEVLTSHPLTESSRFIDMSLSDKGLQISRS